MLGEVGSVKGLKNVLFECTQNERDIAHSGKYLLVRDQSKINPHQRATVYR